MNSVVKLEHKDINTIAFQEASLDIWDKKYRLTAKDGTPIDASMDETYKRVARALADVERTELREQSGSGERRPPDQRVLPRRRQVPQRGGETWLGEVGHEAAQPGP